MNKAITIIGAIVVVAVFAFYMCTFKVKFTELAVLKTFGEYSKEDIIKEPGLYFSWPWPIQNARKVDKRIRIMKDSYSETRTADEQNIMVTTYVCWKIDENNPYKFLISSNDDDDAVAKLKSKVQSEKKAIVAKYNLDEFVNTDKSKFRFLEIERELTERINEVALAEYGIEVVEVGIRRLSFPKTVSQKVFDRMKQDQEEKIARFRALGEAEAQAIRAEANAIGDSILAVANRLADEIEAEAQKEVGEYYREFDSNVELRAFLDRLEVSKEVYKTRTTMVIDSAIAPFGLIDLEKLSSDLTATGHAEPEPQDAVLGSAQ